MEGACTDLRSVLKRECKYNLLDDTKAKMKIQVFFFLYEALYLRTEQLPSHLLSRQKFEAFNPLWVLVVIQKSESCIPKQHRCPEKNSTTTSPNVRFAFQINVFGRRLIPKTAYDCFTMRKRNLSLTKSREFSSSQVSFCEKIPSFS